MDGEYTVATDKKEKIKLESRIVFADWLSSIARGGAEAELRVKTVFVAEGSTIEIIGHSTAGKAPANIQGKIYNNEFIGKILIPEKVKVGAEIWFEAKLPKHGLKTESDTAIPAKPAILASKICWDKDTVKRGDLVKLTCQFEYGVQDGEDALFVIYEHNPNSYDFKVTSFRTTIKNNKTEATWLFNYHEDTAQIPHNDELKPIGKSYAHPQYFFIVLVDDVKIGVNRESGLLKFLDDIEFTINNHNGFAVADHTYTVTFADGSQKQGKLDANGCGKVEKTVPGPYTFTMEGKPPVTGEKGGSKATKTAGDQESGNVEASETAEKNDDTSEKVQANEEKQESTASSGVYNVDNAVKYLNENAGPESRGKCATHVRLAIKAGGIDINPNPIPAKEYEPYLTKYGFKSISSTDYSPRKGDISVIQPYTNGNPNGHITMFNGNEWVSDFYQKDMWSGPGYRTNQPSFTIFRR